LLDGIRSGRDNYNREQGISYPRTNEIRGVPAPDKGGNHNMNRRDAGVMVQKPAPIRFGHLERQRDRAGVIVNVDGWRHGYWHYDPWWCDRFWYWDYYCYVPVPRYTTPSVYYYYGCLPGYVWYWRVVWVSYPVVVYVERPISWVYVRSGYYLERPTYSSMDRAISDIVDAWRYADPGLIERHVRPGDRVAIFLDGEYSYSMEGYDYAAITRDAVLNVRTKSFSVDRVAHRSNDMVVVYATHTFVNLDDYYETVYVAYTLERCGHEWYITEAGSSHRPLVR
jgi:hypothetical protein